MTGEPHLAVARDPDGGGAESPHRDAGFVEGGNSRKQRGAERGCSRRRQRAARQNRAQRHALVGLDGHPETVGIGAPRQHGGEGRMAVLKEPLDTWNSPGRFRGGHRNLVHDDGFPILEHGFPALAGTRVDELDQPRFGLTLGHMGAMVTLPDVAYVIVQPCVGVKDASCVEVCPVDCIHTDDAATMYYIDPDECIDCGACVDPCPVDAIFPEDEVPEQWRDFIKINADYFKK
jgi:NAD-dependent dihydropyrimidine dehydrogenase PreA subunit